MWLAAKPVLVRATRAVWENDNDDDDDDDVCCMRVGSGQLHFPPGGTTTGWAGTVAASQDIIQSVRLDNIFLPANEPNDVQFPLRYNHPARPFQ